MIVVFTNGCFDVLHAGHVRHLEHSRELGDKLIVGINSDASVKLLKGKGRPIVTAEERAIILRALRCVDEVIIFGADTPEGLICRVHPDILTKGPECEWKHVPGREIVEGYGGRVVITPRELWTSTTGILERIKG